MMMMIFRGYIMNSAESGMKEGRQHIKLTSRHNSYNHVRTYACMHPVSHPVSHSVTQIVLYTPPNYLLSL